MQRILTRMKRTATTVNPGSTLTTGGTFAVRSGGTGNTVTAPSIASAVPGRTMVVFNRTAQPITIALGSASVFGTTGNLQLKASGWAAMTEAGNNQWIITQGKGWKVV